MSARRRTLLLAPAALALALLTACGGDEGGVGDGAAASTESTEVASDTSPGDGSAVTIKGFKFAPDELTVAAGTELVVVNDDDVPHTLTANDGSFDTGTLASGEESSITLDEPGEHPYICEIHQYMRGSITVE